jgi:hypothetical protein
MKRLLLIILYMTVGFYITYKFAERTSYNVEDKIIQAHVLDLCHTTDKCDSNGLLYLD